MRPYVVFKVGGEELTVRQAAEKTGIDQETLKKRRYAGWSDERAINTPVQCKSGKVYREDPEKIKKELKGVLPVPGLNTGIDDELWGIMLRGDVKAFMEYKKTCDT
jgi:hypothetical protein